MEKIAITSEGPSMDDQVDPRFGRAAGFVIVDPDTGDSFYLDNGESQVRAQGAGIQAAETVARAGATAVLTGFVGPKAYEALAATGIRVAQDLGNLTLREALQRFREGRVQWTEPSQARGMGK